VDEGEPVPASASADAGPRLLYVRLNTVMLLHAANQGLTLVHVRAQLEQLHYPLMA